MKEHPQPAPPKVSIVILNWNGRDDTLECLESVSRIDYPNFDIIVVDNGSSDNSAAAIRDVFPQVELIETGENLGYAGGNNVGVRHALGNGADYILVLNNDTVVDPEILKAFIAASEQYPEAAVFSGKIYVHDDPERIWYAGSEWSSETGKFRPLGEGESDVGNAYSDTECTDVASGAAFFVPADRFREIGLLDEDFFLYFEETDWCYRANTAGHPAVFVPAAKLWHKVSVSFGGEGSPLALYFITRNRLLWAERHGNWHQRGAVFRGTFRSLWRRFIVPCVRPGYPRTWWWSVRDAWVNPSNRAVYLGTRDYCLRRFGDCPPIVRELNRSSRKYERKHESAPS